MDERKIREQEFHDRRYRADTRARLDRLYERDPAIDLYKSLVAQYSAGKRVLEFGCGTSTHALEVAGGVQSVIGIDISPVAVQRSRDLAAELGIAAEFQVMDAESLLLEDDSVDLVCGSGILHHLDLKGAVKELQRVLAPGGRALFMEPLGHNPLLNLARRLTPQARTEDEHPLVMSDLKFIERGLGPLRVEAFHLLGLIGKIPYCPQPVASVLIKADTWLFRRVPSLKRFAWMAVIVIDFES